MPELPEVETIKNELSPHVVGRRITRIELLWERMVRQPSAEEFRSGLVGQKIIDLERRGKYLLFQLSGGDTLIIHLKMTGSLWVKSASEEPDKYIRAVIYLDDGTTVHFRDLRKFGAIWLVKDVNSVIGELGRDPFDPEFTPQLLAELIGNRSALVKALLCDQTLIAGIGNMYADEVLFAARINPLRPGNSLTKEEMSRLHQAIRQVLETAIGRKGASVNTYFRPDGTQGTAHFEFKVAHRRGERCLVCGDNVERIKVRNRGTYFCPKCQRAG